ncbi:flagellar basal body P-ring formation chaperone FlgA [Thioalkalicoccus limnaeus]|uniref:Flagella basal body P-ring formation protein FlgA n=1 Tax=Thioalkalicoccus limnaeus TaxID=120681 RepID=A0ABV4BBQ7_9GAMM
MLLCAAFTLPLSSPAPAEQIQDLEGIRLAVESFVRAQTHEERGDPTVEVTNLDSRLRLRACDDGLRTFFAPGSRGGSRLTVGVNCPAPNPWTIYVSARVIYRGEVLIAARSLPRGAVLSETDLVVEERDLDQSPSGYLSEPYEALGKRTTRPLRSGLPVTVSALESVKIVERGQRIWLVVESPALSVRVAATALEGGAPGERIRAENTATRQVVEGVVDDDGTVRVGPRR